MRVPPNVPRIGQQPPQFPGQLRYPVQSPQVITSPEQQIQESMQDMAMEIYARLAVLVIDGSSSPPSAESLRQLASQAQTAAKAYWEAMGVQVNG